MATWGRSRRPLRPEPGPGDRTDLVLDDIIEDARLDRDRLESALDELAVGVIITGAVGEPIFINGVAESIVGAHDRRTLVAVTVREVTEAARRGDEGSRVIDIFGPPAESYAVSARTLGVERPGEVVVFIENVSERHRLDQVRRDFVANISHELKSPVGAVGLLAETLVGESDPEVVARLSARLSGEVERLSDTIDDLLELSRIEFGEDADVDDVDIASIVEEAVTRLRTAAEARGVRIDVEPGPQHRVHGDRRQLVSAVANLLDNAVKYSSADSDVTVSVADGADGSVSIAVEDRGTGIPARDLDRIFERFYRVDRGRGRGTGGTGLGLAIVRHVAHNHRGTATVSSREGRGSTFTLTLPAVES